jgi:hypothetical protein
MLSYAFALTFAAFVGALGWLGVLRHSAVDLAHAQSSEEARWREVQERAAAPVDVGQRPVRSEEVGA